jgi:hypothetical protein
MSPRSIGHRRRALAARRRQESTGAGGSRSAWPSRITVAELDELAVSHGVVFGDDVKTKADKQAALEAAGVTAEG